ncbi:unnamed protein product, partial [Ectocarpus fasciculatus]
MARTPGTHPRVASLYLLVAAAAVVLHADAQRDCNAETLACGDSATCNQCVAASEDVFVDCVAGIDLEFGSCEYTEQQACCLNEASGVDCIGDQVTFEFFECLYDNTELCDGGWTCSGTTGDGGDTTPAPAAASGTDTPVAGGAGDGAETVEPTPAAAPSETSAPAAAGGDEGTVMPTVAGDRGGDASPSDTTAPAAAPATDGGETMMPTTADERLTFAPYSDDDGGMPGAPSDTTTAPAAADGGAEAVMPTAADGDRALDITPAPSSRTAAMPSETTTTSMAGESETMSPTAAGDGDRDLDTTPFP